MSFSTCPIATINAPIEQVWRLLADPSRCALWWDAETVSIIPEGPAHVGQRVVAITAALGKKWDVHVTVQAVASEKRQLDLLTQLPFGITVHNHIACTPLDSQHTRVSFG
ncbi:MAG: SRPBCC family protein [Vicinamibacterales bacterium]